LTGGPVIAFPGLGAQSTSNAIHLGDVSYGLIGKNICVTAYPEKIAPE
jgi:hypothetical protein